MDYEKELNDILTKKFIKIIGKAYYNNFAEEIDVSKYNLDASKAKKLIALLDYCKKLANDNDAKIEYCVTKKQNQPAELSIRFENDLIFGTGENDLEEFIKALNLCDGININGTGLPDGSFLISFFIENLYTPK